MRIGRQAGRLLEQRFVAVVTVLLLLVAGCGGDSGSGDTEAPATSAATETTSDNAPTTAAPETTEAELEPVTLTAVSAWPMNQTSHTGPFLVFVETVEELSGGAIQVDVIGGSETMSVFDINANLGTGSMDLALSTAGYYEEAIPEGVVFAATTKSPQEWRDEGLYDVVNEWHTERMNQLVLGRLGWGQRYALFSTVPVATVDDFDGLRFRASNLYVGLLTELGVEPINIPPPDIYTALERGTVQGSAWTDIGATQLGLHEVIDQVILPPYYNSAINLNINLDTWQALSPAAQDIIMDAVIAAEEASEGLMQAEWEKELALYEEAGVEIFEFQGEDAERYIEASRIGILTEFERSGFDEATTNELLELFAD